MQTKRGRLRAVRGVLLAVVLGASTIGCSGRARGVDRFYGIVNSPAADGKLVAIDVRDQNDVTITPLGLIPMTTVFVCPVTSTWTGAEPSGFCRKP